MPGDDDPEIEDTSSLTDADWVEINQLNHAYKADGDEGLEKAFEHLLQHDWYVRRGFWALPHRVPHSVSIWVM